MGGMQNKLIVTKEGEKERKKEEVGMGSKKE